MKQFKNLLEAVGHNHYCPFCEDKMSTDIDSVYDENVHKAYFKFGSSKVIVDCVTNDIIQYSEGSSVETTYGIGCDVPIVQKTLSLPGLITNGINYRKINITCGDCCKYGYLVQVLISLEHRKIVGYFLNSETISVEEGAKLYEIKNIYATGKTEMSTFHQHLSKQRGTLDKVDLPLVPLDFKNPMKTIERIKNLLVFL